MRTATDTFGPYEKPKLNPIQRAQNAYTADPRLTDPTLPPEERKHGLAQGFLLNNKEQEAMTAPNGKLINQTPGKLFQMGAVTEADMRLTQQMAADPDEYRYLSPKDPTLISSEELAKKIIFGTEDPELLARITTVPLTGMAPSFSNIFQLLQKQHPDLNTVLLGTNAYGGYKSVLETAFENVKKYRQGTEDNEFDMASFRESIEALEDPENTLLLLQSDAYNYTGVNPTSEQKQEIIEILKEHGVITLVDSAYQGLTNGPEEDVEIARLLGKTDLPFIVYDSWSKKAGLYGKRIAFVHIATGSEEQAATLRSNMYAQIRSNLLAVSPAFKVIHHLLTDEALEHQWLKELEMASQILYVTKVKMAETLGEGFEYIHPDNTQGMFNKFNISHEGGKVLADQYGIFVVDAEDEDTGKQSLRVNMGAIPEQDIEYIAASIKAVYAEHRTD